MLYKPPFLFSEFSNLDFRMYQSSKDMSPDKDRALLDAIKQNNLDEVISLIENGVNINPETKDWTISPLQVAIYLGHEQIAKTLILKGAKTNMQDSDGIYPIHRAVQKNQREVVEILLQHGADIEVKYDNLSSTPIAYATSLGSIEMVKLLLCYGAKIDQPYIYNSIKRAIYENKMDILKMFWKARPNLNQPCFVLLLYSKVSSGEVEIAEMLIDNGLDVNSCDILVNEERPIHIAITYTKINSIKITEMLLRKGASMKIKTKDGHTPLECALKKESARKLELMKVIFHHHHNSTI